MVGPFKVASQLSQLQRNAPANSPSKITTFTLTQSQTFMVIEQKRILRVSYSTGLPTVRFLKPNPKRKHTYQMLRWPLANWSLVSERNYDATLQRTQDDSRPHICSHTSLPAPGCLRKKENVLQSYCQTTSISLSCAGGIPLWPHCQSNSPNSRVIHGWKVPDNRICIKLPWSS